MRILAGGFHFTVCTLAKNVSKSHLVLLQKPEQLRVFASCLRSRGIDPKTLLSNAEYADMDFFFPLCFLRYILDLA